MKRNWILVGVFALFMVVGLLVGVVVERPLDAQQVVTDQLGAIGYEGPITVSTTAVAFGAAAANARAAVCTLEGTAQVRYRYDGGIPTSSEGHLSATPSATTPVALSILGVNNVARFRAIRASADATLRCTYLR